MSVKVIAEGGTHTHTDANDIVVDSDGNLWVNKGSELRAVYASRAWLNATVTEDE